MKFYRQNKCLQMKTHGISVSLSVCFYRHKQGRVHCHVLIEKATCLIANTARFGLSAWPQMDRRSMQRMSMCMTRGAGTDQGIRIPIDVRVRLHTGNWWPSRGLHGLVFLLCLHRIVCTPKTLLRHGLSRSQHLPY